MIGTFCFFVVGNSDSDDPCIYSHSVKISTNSQKIMSIYLRRRTGTCMLPKLLSNMPNNAKNAHKPLLVVQRQLKCCNVPRCGSAWRGHAWLKCAHWDGCAWIGCTNGVRVHGHLTHLHSRETVPLTLVCIHAVYYLSTLKESVAVYMYCISYHGSYVELEFFQDTVIQDVRIKQNGVMRSTSA